MYKYILLSVVLAISTILASFSSFSDDANRQVIVVDNLQNVAKLAKLKKLPVMIFFAAEDCEFCDALEADYLSAMSLAEEYNNKVIIRKVMIDAYEDVYDFQGKNISTEDFSRYFKVRVTPTLLLVDYRGDALTRKIIGYNRSGFFGAYLDEAIDEANRKIRTEKVSVLHQN